MTISETHDSSDAPTMTPPGFAVQRTAASYKRELAQLRVALAQEGAMRRQRDALFEQREVLSRESDHRLLNGLQLIVSLLLLQSRASKNAEVTLRLSEAANRVSVIERVHRQLHCADDRTTVAFKEYLEVLCQDFSSLLSSEERPGQIIAVEGIGIDLQATTAIPLGFIVNELVTNAVKHGGGRIVVRLEPDSGKKYRLSVLNDGQCLPENFDPAACKGLGMKIIGSLTQQIGAELRFGPGEQGLGPQFTVLFS